MNGFLFIDKQSDWTSRDVCNKAQSLFHEKKVGHSGTLDPFATGLLILCLGNATKAISILEGADKEYLATLQLGVKTDTGDITGAVIEEKPVPSLSPEKINAIFHSLIGKQEQIPPMTSAVHVNGRKLYTYHYQGEEVERKPREIYINSLVLESFSSSCVTFRCQVSKGTYIRTLGESIAEKLGTVGHLISLRRLGIAKYSVEEAKPLNEVKPEDVKSILQVLQEYLPVITMDEAKSKFVKNGAKIHLPDISPSYDKILVVDALNHPLAIYENDHEDVYRCFRGL